LPYADLHTHTHCSDGRLSPSALVEAAAEQGIRVLSVTDHDTIEGLAEAGAAAKRHGVQLVAGVELSVTVDGEEVHLLGYGFDPEHDGLNDHLTRFVQVRRERAEQMVARLRTAGVDLSLAAVEDAARHAQAVGRPHVATALVEGGHVDSAQEAFDRFLAAGQPAFVEKPPVPAGDVLALLHDAGGIGVLAHPGHWTPSQRLRRLVDAGLDGIETTHPSHDSYLRDYYRRWAASHDLVATGGSDYHGREEPDDTAFGRLGLSGEEWARLQPALA
jgi:predicted metal-dependent phosphoesterase TrpH